MLGTYRDVLRLPGAARFSGAGYIARQPLSIIGLGIVVYISGTTGSYGEAGLLAAAFQIPAALFALVTSRLVDRFGQGRVLIPLVIVNALALSAFVIVVQAGWPLIIQAIVIAIVGASQPSIGAIVRARWAYVIGRDGRPEQLRSAFALESIVDEVIFTIGPILVTVLALRVALPAPLFLGAALLLTGGLLLAMQRTTEPPPTPAAHTAASGAVLRRPGMPIAVLAAIGLGMVFGAYEVATVAFCTDRDAPGASGLVLAVWALGSMLGGLWFGSRHWRIHLPSQAALTLWILTAVLLPAPFISNVPVLALATFAGGAFVAPALISGFSLAERLVPAERLTEGLTWATSGLALGVSAGAALGGWVIDRSGPSQAFLLPVAGAAVAALLITLRRRVLIASVRAYTEDPPAVVPIPDPVPGPSPGTVRDDAE